MVATGQDMNDQGKNILQGQGNSGNFTSSQGKLKSLKEVRKTRNFKSTFVHFTGMNRVDLVQYC